MTQTSLSTSLCDVRRIDGYAIVEREPCYDDSHYIANSLPSKSGLARRSRLFPVHVDALGLPIPVNVLHKSLIAPRLEKLFGHRNIVAAVGG